MLASINVFLNGRICSGSFALYVQSLRSFWCGGFIAGERMVETMCIFHIAACIPRSCDENTCQGCPYFGLLVSAQLCSILGQMSPEIAS